MATTVTLNIELWGKVGYGGLITTMTTRGSLIIASLS